MYNTKIENCNTTLLEQQKTTLINDIVFGENKSYFKVYDLESGTGKTRTAEQGIVKALMETERNFILVRESNKNCVESADIINRLYGGTVALAYNNETIPENKRRQTQENFMYYRVLVITHQKYCVLSIDKNKRKCFAKGRNNLIIDEFIAIDKKIKIDMTDIKTYRAIFEGNSVILHKFDEIIRWLEDELISNPEGKNFVRFGTEYPTKAFHELNKLIKNNMSNQILSKRIEIIRGDCHCKINNELLDNISTFKQLCNNLLTIKEYYKQLCYIEGGVLYATDTRYQMWLLENNILLDATGKLQIAYNLNKDIFHLVGCDKVLDHSKWTLLNIRLETTVSAKNKITNFYDVANDIINNCGDKTLVVGNKNDMNYLKVPETSKVYHYNLVGSNAWYDYENVVVLQTPNLSNVDFILKFLYYAKVEIENIPSFKAYKRNNNGKARYQFLDPRLEDIRTKHIAQHLYQAIKRVNRNMKYDTKAILIINNDDVISLLKEFLYGCKVEIIENNDFEQIKTKQDMYNQKRTDNSQAAQFITLLTELIKGKHPELQLVKKQDEVIPGVYAKKTLREYLNIKSAVHFSNNVLSKTNVISFCEHRNISLTGQHIKIS